MEIQNFNFKENNVRIVIDGNDEPWFVAKDICDVLGYTNASKAIIDHIDEDDKLNNEALRSLGQRGGWLINESGLYSLILSSKLPSAKEFKRWVTREVLPSIRKNGGYIANQEKLTPAEILANAMIVAQNVIEEQRQKIEKQRREIVEYRPKADVYDAIVENSNLRNATQVAQKLGKSAVALNKYLESIGVFNQSVKRGRTFKAWFISDGYGILRTTENGFTQPMYTAKGEAWITQKAIDDGFV